jgi:hypothetical protein
MNRELIVIGTKLKGFPSLGKKNRGIVLSGLDKRQDALRYVPLFICNLSVNVVSISNKSVTSRAHTQIKLLCMCA